MSGGAVTIRPGDGLCLLINLFTVRADRQAAFIDLQLAQTRRFRVHMPGFVSSSFHCGIDGDRVLNLAQWRRAADVDAARASGDFKGHLAALSRFEFRNRMRLYRPLFASGPLVIDPDADGVVEAAVYRVIPGSQGRLLDRLLDSDGTGGEEGPRARLVLKGLAGDSVALYQQWAPASAPPEAGALAGADWQADSALYRVVSADGKG